MSESSSVKPEPSKARVNWSYQAYFLSQRQRFQKTCDETARFTDTGFVESNSNNTLPAMTAEERKKVIAQMEALAASVGICITLSEQPK